MENRLKPGRSPRSPRRIFRRRYPRLDWIQVEITSDCNGRCRYCPRYAFRRKWQSRNLPLADFASLQPAFKKTRLVYLQGWGEPFLHPDLFDMINIAKAAGCQVGTTTNGTLLDPSAADRLVSEGLDIIAFSLAGLSANKNDQIRRRTRLDTIVRAIEDLHRAKDKHKKNVPAIHIAYMLLRSNLKEIDEMPTFFAGLGADQVVVSSLSLVTAPEWSQEAVLAETPAQWQHLWEKVLKMREEGARRGVDMHFQLTPPGAEPGPCEENIRRALVIGANGKVAPCVMAGIPVKGNVTCYFDRKPHRLWQLSFGNIREQSLAEIWRRPEYRRFRRRFTASKLPPICCRCYKSRMTNVDQPAALPSYDLFPG